MDGTRKGQPFAFLAPNTRQDRLEQVQGIAHSLGAYDPGAKKGKNQFKLVNTKATRLSSRSGEGISGHACRRRDHSILVPALFRHPRPARLGNLEVAQALARHSNISTTSLYAHPADDELDKVYRETFEKK